VKDPLAGAEADPESDGDPMSVLSHGLGRDWADAGAALAARAATIKIAGRAPPWCLFVFKIHPPGYALKELEDGASVLVLTDARYR
jgi:hypothetical protein